MRAPSTPALLVAVLLLGAPDAARAQDMIAVSFTGKAFLVDSATGAGVPVGDTGFTRLNAMAVDGKGRVYAAENDLAITVPDDLVRIDPATGAGTLAAATTLFDIRGLAFDAQGVLYAIEDTAFGPNDGLFTLDPGTGVATAIGDTGFAGIQGLAFLGAALYGWDVEQGLILLDPASGKGQNVNGAKDGFVDIQALAGSDAGALFGVRDVLISVDPVKGGVQKIGAGSYSDLRGIDFLGVPDLVAAPVAIAVSTGGVQGFQLAAGADLGGRFYLLLGSLSGTAPGIPLGAVTLPLNVDVYTTAILGAPNTAPFQGFFGVLDAAGKAGASLAIPPGLNPAVAVGLTLHHAYLVIEVLPANVKLRLASQPVSLDLVP